jgi:NAD(P)-dependent dehydrogenase (short-subunit alcohol dehydrogenase family)
MPSPVCAITGVGPGNGAAFTRCFSGAGYRVAMLARSEDRLRGLETGIPNSKGYAVDVADADSVRDGFARIRAELGPVEVLLYNAGSGAFGDFQHTSADLFEYAWRVNALGLLLCSQAVVPDMLVAGGGAIVVTGATASLRGGANFAAFAPAKAAQRSLAQSMSRSLGPQGIHVALAVVDGVIDIPNTRSMFPNQPDEFYLKPDDIAATVLHLAQQPRSAWTFELDLRPFTEKW